MHRLLGEERLTQLAASLGRELVRRGRNLVSGFGLGIGSVVVAGAAGAVYEDPRASLQERLVLRPFPRQPPTGMTRERFQERYREDMLADAGFVVLLAGNKRDANGQVIPASGMEQEWAIAKEIGHCYPIPIGATGHVAAEIHAEIMAHLADYYGTLKVKPWFEVLGNPASSNDELLEAVFRIIDLVEQG